MLYQHQRKRSSFIKCGTSTITVSGEYMSTTSIRINDQVYARLELNAKGYESVSDTIDRANKSLETLEMLEMLDTQVACCIKDFIESKITRERVILTHHKPDAIQSAMNIIDRIYYDFHVHCEINTNMVRISVALRA
jgi:hypothetical protein